MNRHIMQSILVLVLVFFASCSTEDILEKMKQIQRVGDENPQKALIMLDSLEIEIRESSRYARSKYDLLRIRLNDKADHIPSSDIAIKELMEYFDQVGSAVEKQEVYYYAGSVYRDLQDTPRAMEYFLRSLEYAADNHACDSIMLRNTYSNLSYLYYRVQNFADAARMSEKELEACKRLKVDDMVAYLHTGTDYLALDNARLAQAAFDTVLTRITKEKDIIRYQTYLIYLLCHYSELGNIPKARKCFALITDDPLKNYDAFSCISFAQYYASSGRPDSAAIYCKRILDDGKSLNDMYDAAKLLFRIYSEKGDVHNACLYAGKYMQLSDSLDFGKRQELAATVNNQHLYHLDQKKEQELKDEKEKYRNTLILVSFAAILLAGAGYILYVRRRNKDLQERIRLSLELQRVSNNEKLLHEEIAQKERELAKSKKSLDQSSAELDHVKRELQRVNTELSEYDEVLKAKEQQLSEKIVQNKTFIKLLHQSELEGTAEDVIHAIRQSSTGKKEMKSADWKRLYQAVDELYPLFKERLLKELGTFTEQQMQVCYLMRIGLSKPQIQNMTGLSRVTVWRWVKKYDWALNPDNENKRERGNARRSS